MNDPLATFPDDRARMVRRSMLPPYICAYCGGTGNLPAESFEADGAMVGCDRCGGTGDLDGLRLLEAYRCGRRDVQEGFGATLREAIKVLELAVDLLEDRALPVQVTTLRARVGG